MSNDIKSYYLLGIKIFEVEHLIVFDLKYWLKMYNKTSTQPNHKLLKAYKHLPLSLNSVLSLMV